MNIKSDQSSPLVSVCIPTYNRAEKLQRAVSSLILAEYKNLEIIISDNFSTDKTEEICNELSASDNRIKYFRHNENCGPIKNFTFARGKATGKYFIWCGDDDYFDSEYINKCVDSLEKDSSLVLVSGVAAYHDERNVITHHGRIIQLLYDFSILRVIKYIWLVGDNSIFYGVYRSSGVGGCQMPNILAGDWGWMASVLLRGKAKVIPSIFVHRNFELSISSSKANIVAAIKAPQWQSRFPWVAMSMNVAKYLVFESNEYQGKSEATKFVTFFLIYLLLLMKGAIENVRLLLARIPYARLIYRRYFKGKLVW